MPRYIDADALFKKFEDEEWYDNFDRDEIAEDLLLNAPTVDVQDFTSDERKLLECVLMSAIFECQSRISVLKLSSPEEKYKREQLKIHEKSLAEYKALLEKIKVMEKQLME